MRTAALALAVGLLALGKVLSADAAPASTATIESQHPLIVVTFANDPRPPAGQAGSTARRYTGGGYTLAQRAHKQAQRIASTYSLHEVASWPIKTLSVHCVVYEVPDNRPVQDILAALAKDPQVSLAQPLQQFHTLTQPPADSAPPAAPLAYNDPLYDLQTNLTALNIPQAHQSSQGAGVRIALIDTGVDLTHPDLHERIAGTHSFISSHIAPAGSYRHGTAMAGLMAAAANNRIGIVGVAPLAQIEVFEACWQLKPDADAAACNTFTLAQALAGAIEARIPLVNISLSGPADPLLSSLVEAGLRRGMIFVGASGSPEEQFPTGIAGVIAVGASEQRGDPGSKATVTAPAMHVLTLRPQGQYDFASGTSVASAEVSGIVALLLATDPHLSAAAVQSILRQSPDGAAPDTNAPAPVNASAAVAHLQQETARRLASRVAR
jgi:subtilisin family serine protease